MEEGNLKRGLKRQPRGMGLNLRAKKLDKRIYSRNKYQFIKINFSARISSVRSISWKEVTYATVNNILSSKNTTDSYLNLGTYCTLIEISPTIRPILDSLEVQDKEFSSIHDQ